MGIPLAYSEIAPIFVPFRGQESCHESSGNAYSSQHHNHGSRVMFTIPCFSREKKFLKRMTECGCVSFKTIPIILQEMLLDRQRSLKWGRGLLADAIRQACDLLCSHGN